MKSVFKRALAACAFVGGVVLPLAVRVAPVAAVGALLPGCAGPDCELRNCDALVSGSSLTTNGGTYTHCLSCDASGDCEVVLQDDTGATFFDCTDGQGTDCTSATVNAEFAYCDVQ